MSKCRIIVIEAKPVRRQRLLQLVGEIADTRIVAGSATLMEAYSLIESDPPDLVLICSRMSKAPEHVMLAELMRVLGTSSLELAEGIDDASLKALVEQHVRRAARSANRLPPRTKPRAFNTAEPRQPVRGTQIPTGHSGGGVRPPTHPQERRTGGDAAPPREPGTGGSPGSPLVLIGASTGGVEALHRLLVDFPADCPPVLVVQHIRGAFSSAFAKRLDRVCAAEVCEAREGGGLGPGRILIAPGAEAHLLLAGRHPIQTRLVVDEPVTGHRPSVDALFTSALPFADRVVAALLTGMGQDGARGLLALRRAGAHTIAQDRETSTVYGMPRVAAEIGAACQILPLSAIAGAVMTAATEIGSRQGPVRADHPT